MNEVSLLRDAELAVIDSVWGHAGTSVAPFHSGIVFDALMTWIPFSRRRGERCRCGVHYKEDQGVLGLKIVPGEVV